MTAINCLQCILHQECFIACGRISAGMKSTSIVSGGGRKPSRSSLGNTLSFLDKDICPVSLWRSMPKSPSHFRESSLHTPIHQLFFFLSSKKCISHSCISVRMIDVILKLLLIFLYAAVTHSFLPLTGSSVRMQS